MLSAVNAVMDTHFLTPVGPAPLRADAPGGGRPARGEPGMRRYLVAGKYRLYPFDQTAKPYFDEACQRLHVALSDYSFANNVIWLAQASGFYQIIEGCLCLFALNGNGLTMLLPPLGEPSRQRRALRLCVRIMDLYNPSPYQARVDFVYRDFIRVLEADVEGSTLVNGERWLVEETNPDYIYRTQDLIELKGNAYKTKRNEINQFRRAHPDHALVPFNRAHREAALALVNTWMQNRLRALPDGPVEEILYNLEMERKAIQRAIALYDDLKLEGLSLFIDGRLEGFTFGERLSPDVANVLIEKTNFNIQGAAQYLFREFTKVFTDCSYVNVGDDLGFENLRRVKMSYRPAMFGEKIVLRRPVPG
ncbi:MAG TPA: phosphatidylglycerol lysyltransferase domain-containing protein [Acidiferrobacterales bacterium]